MTGINLSAALGRFCALYSVRNTAPRSEVLRTRTRGKAPLMTWPSHFVQTSVIVSLASTLAKDDALSHSFYTDMIMVLWVPDSEIDAHSRGRYFCTFTQNTQR